MEMSEIIKELKVGNKRRVGNALQEMQKIEKGLLDIRRRSTDKFEGDIHQRGGGTK